MPERSARTLWEAALGQLELQVSRPNFDTWLRHTVGLRLDSDSFVVGTPSDFAVEWLRSRMSALIGRTVSPLLGGPIAISFEVIGAQPASAPPSSNGQAAATAPAPDLNPHLTFEAFTVVKSNRLAHRAAQRIASANSSYNPLVLFGAPGLGKTHLLHAIGHEAARSGKRVLALTGEAFVTGYGRAVRAGHPHTFGDQFQDCQLLLLDDLAFLTTRTASQELFFHIFNTLHAAGRFIALTVDHYPETINRLTPRLRSRLLAGLTAELLLPPPDELLTILQAKASLGSQPLPKPVLHVISTQPFESIRELEGALNRVVAYADLSSEPLSPDTALQALHPLRPPQRELSPDDILQAVCRHFQLSLDQLTGPSRARDITYARHIAVYLLRRLGSHRLTEIGKLLGNRDHSTVLKGFQRIKREFTAIPQTRTDIQQLEASLLHDQSA